MRIQTLSEYLPEGVVLMRDEASHRLILRVAMRDGDEVCYMKSRISFNNAIDRDGNLNYQFPDYVRAMGALLLYDFMQEVYTTHGQGD